MLPCWRIREMKALIVFCVLMNEFAITRTVLIHCPDNSVIKDDDVTCNQIQCPQGECTDKTRHIISTECLKQHECILPDCLYQDRHIKLSYICHNNPIISCNFEVDFCNWDGNGFARLIASDTEHKVDFTTKSDYGHLLLSHMKGSTLSSPEIYGNQTVCLTFSYILSYNSRIDIFNIGTDSKTNVSIGTVSYSRDNTHDNIQTMPWKNHKMTAYNVFSISFTTMVNNDDTAFVAIDDIDVVPGKCGEMFKQEENFENKKKIAGTILQGETIPDERKLCPKTDHTTFSEKGHYLIVEENNNNKLMSYKFDATVCLTFWYMVTENTELLLNVHLSTGISEQVPIPISKNSAWAMQFKTLMINGDAISFSIKSKTIESCIAVDDISLSKGYCADRRVKDWFQSGINQLECPFVNIPGKQISVLTQPQYDSTDINCQNFISTLETNIVNNCIGIYFEMCQINRDNLISYDDYCFTQLHRINVSLSCTEITTRPQSSPRLQTTPITTEETTEHLLVTTAKRKGEMNSSGNTGLIVGVVVSLLLVCIVVLSLFLFRKRFSFFKTKLCGEDNPGLNTRPREPRDVQEYDYLDNRKSKDHVYNTASDHIYNTTSDHVYNIPSDKDLDGVVYTSIDYEPLPATISNKEVNTPPNKGLHNERIMFIKSKPKDFAEKSPLALSHPAYAVSVTGFNHGEKSEKETKVCLSNDKKAEPDKCNDFDPQKLNSKERFSENPHETGIDRSKSTSVQSCDLPDDYSVLDPSITGFDRTNEKEAKTVNNGDDYTVLDPNETGFQKSVQIDEDIEGNGCYTILDPTKTGFDRSNTIKNDGIFNKNDVYELAKPLPTQSEYEICPKEGNYDILGSERETDMDKENIYNHAPDTVYDTTSHVLAKDRDEETYDHFTGHS